MSQFVAIENIQAVLTRKTIIPTVVMWNRLEARPRTTDFVRALRAEIRDPLWMLTKQWQMGEFEGDDAGSPIFAKVHMTTSRLTKYRAAGDEVEAFNNDVPLESLVERQPIPLGNTQGVLSLDIRLLMGRQWIKLIKSIGLDHLVSDYKSEYSIQNPNPNAKSDSVICAHTKVWQQFAAVAGRAMDGGGLYLYLKEDSSRHAYDDITVTEAEKVQIDTLADKFIRWYEELFYQPNEEGNTAWQPSNLEYQFDVSTEDETGEKVFTAEEYYHGKLDWYNFDIDPQQQTLGVVDEDGPQPAVESKKFTHSFLPANVQFDGMPNTRWWSFEDGETNFGDIKPDTTDINKLLLMEFGLIYANDWFLLPFTLPAGSVAQVKGLAVTNVFGERTWVEPSGKGDDEDWQRWAMFGIATRGSESLDADTSLLILPTTPKINESEALEEAYLIRDEVSNMVWGIETTVPLADGSSKPGRAAADELFKRLKAILDSEIEGGLPPAEETDYQANIRYQLMTSVPENWIPFIPTHLDNDNREIQLQRASMPRIIPGNPLAPEKIKPRTVLLRHGLDELPAKPYYVFEEEVTRSGVRIAQSYQRARWYDGSVYTWKGVRKHTGRGEGSSGLAFDTLKPVKRA